MAGQRGSRTEQIVLKSPTSGVVACVSPPAASLNLTCNFFPYLQKLLILNREMMQMATALITVLSVLSAPIASAICRQCCQHPLEHQLAFCHDKAHARLGPHVHHMDHVRMDTQESDADTVVQQCEHEWQNGRPRCQRTGCLSAKPVQVSVVSVSAHQLRVPSLLIATPICSSLTISGPLQPPGDCRIGIDSSPSASAPLRI